MAERETCLVTGASGGIGGAIALKMAAEGRNVVLHYAGNEGAARAVEEEIHKAYPSVETLLCQGDIKKEEDVERIVAEAVARFSEIEVLVNNAGITRDNLFLKMSSEDFDEVLDANLRGAFLFSKAVGKLMMKKRYGRIIQISSIVGVKEEMLRNIPMKAFGTGEDVANAVAFFAKKESRYITGETLLVDGGMGM